MVSLDLQYCFLPTVFGRFEENKIVYILSPEEAQLLEQENDQLIEQLNQLHNQVDQVSYYFI